MSKYLIIRGLFVLLLLILLTIDFFIADITAFMILFVGVFIFMIVIGSARLRTNFFINGHHDLNTKRKAIALTFDDGPDAVHTPKILEILDRYDAKATFFCIGKHIKENASTLKEIVDKGHRIGNHSYSHSNSFPFFSRKKVIRELEQTNELIEKATGKECNIFRPPFGVTNPQIARAANFLQMKLIGWNIRSYDTSRKPEAVVRKVIKKIKPGAVILLHDNRENTPEILEAILQYTQKNEYSYLHVQDHI